MLTFELSGIVLRELKLGGYQSGQLGQTVNLLSYDFVGSNPALPTYLMNEEASVTQLVECQPSKLNVAGSIPVTRFQKPLRMALKAIPRDTPGRAILLMRSQTRSHGD